MYVFKSIVIGLSIFLLNDNLEEFFFLIDLVGWILIFFLLI